MTPCAESVALGSQLQAVRVVAIAARDPGPVHLALQERAIDVDLILDLTVGVIEILGQQRDPIVVEDRLTVLDDIAKRLLGQDTQGSCVQAVEKLFVLVCLPRPRGFCLAIHSFRLPSQCDSPMPRHLYR